MYRMISECDLSNNQTENSMSQKKDFEQSLSVKEALKEFEEVFFLL